MLACGHGAGWPAVSCLALSQAPAALLTEEAHERPTRAHSPRRATIPVSQALAEAGVLLKEERRTSTGTLGSHITTPSPALCPPLVQALAGAGVLLKEEAYEHKYPYDWRTKRPTIFRATDQVGARLPASWTEGRWRWFVGWAWSRGAATFRATDKLRP